MLLPEDDLTCPVCCDIFTDPILLACSHSFCRACLRHCWDAGSRDCPVCRKRASKAAPPSNLALRNVCEALLEVRRNSVALDEALICGLHGERLKLFCLADKQPICVVCQTSRLHKSHECSPVEEAVLDCKEELASSLQSLQDKLVGLKRIQQSSSSMSKHIKTQAQEARRSIRSQFEQLRHTLAREESERLAAVEREEEEKLAGMKDKMRELSAEVLSIAETISVIGEQLKEDDMALLKNFKATEDRSKSFELGSDNASGLLMDVTNHLYNLKYRVWEKMLDHIYYTPVTLDPNTAHPYLILSDDLTSLHYSKQPGSCPDNPERFHLSPEVVAMSPLGSGTHRWLVETGGNTDWILGVASGSVPRNAEILARPENGFWTLCFRDGEFRALTSPPTPLTLSHTPEQIRVQVDYNKGTVSFLEPADDAAIFTFNHTFTETLLPYFYTHCSDPLRIVPEKVLVTMLRQ